MHVVRVLSQILVDFSIAVNRLLLNLEPAERALHNEIDLAPGIGLANVLREGILLEAGARVGVQYPYTPPNADEEKAGG